MKQFLIVAIFVGLSTGRYLEEEIHNEVLKRFTRNSDKSGSLLDGQETLILHQCDVNFRFNKKDVVKASYNEMMECFKKKRIYQVSKEEYLEHIEECTEDFRETWKLCLSASQKYYPDYVKKRDEAVIAFDYENNEAVRTANFTLRNDILSCFNRVETYVSTQKLNHCLKSLETDDPLRIGPKEETCREMAIFAECYRKHYEPCEEDFKSIIWYRDGLLAHTWKPCI